MSALQNCLEDLYLEVFPVPGMEESLLDLPNGSHLGVTCSPKQGLDATLELVQKLQGHDFHLVPHIAARQVRDRQHLRDILHCLQDMEVKAVFVPGGDIEPAVGEFDSSLELLRCMAEEGHGFRHLGVAAYPEGHPAIADEVLLEALQEKQKIATYMVTQMCFDAQRMLDWLSRVRALGIQLPVWLGLPGVMDRMKLFKTSLRIGVGESARFARKQRTLAGKLLRSAHYRPDDLVMALERGIAEPSYGIGGFYLFSFNQVSDTLAWQHDMLRQLALSQKIG
jgi:methylenetetrahydrofolate reductase (NADPH)